MSFLTYLQRKRQEYVNKPWKQILTDYSKRQADQAGKQQKPPPKLLMVRRVKTAKGRPKKEKNILRDLGVEEVITSSKFVIK